MSNNNKVFSWVEPNHEKTTVVYGCDYNIHDSGRALVIYKEKKNRLGGTIKVETAIVPMDRTIYIQDMPVGDVDKVSA